MVTFSELLQLAKIFGKEVEEKIKIIVLNWTRILSHFLDGWKVMIYWMRKIVEDA